MRQIVFDEVSQIEEILNNKIVRGISIKGFIVLLAKYYYEDFKEETAVKYKKELQNIINDLEMPDGYEEYLYDTYIEKVCRELKNGNIDYNLKHINQIDITKSEMDIVLQGENDKEKKFLFTLYVLAKTILHPTGWVNYKINQIVGYGNLQSCSVNDVCMMTNKLWNKGLMDFNHKMGSSGYKVELGKDIDDVAMSITNFTNLGNQLLVHIKPGWKMCQECGRMIKIKFKGGNPQKYCKRCAEEVNRQKTRERMKNKQKSKSDI